MGNREVLQVERHCIETYEQARAGEYAPVTHSFVIPPDRIRLSTFKSLLFSLTIDYQQLHFMISPQALSPQIQTRSCSL